MNTHTEQITYLTTRDIKRVSWVSQYLIETSNYDVDSIYSRRDIVFFNDTPEDPEKLADDCNDAMDTDENLYSMLFGCYRRTEFVIVLAYQKRSEVIKLNGTDTDHLQVLLGINRVIKPGHEIRYWAKHPADQYPLFLPLKQEEWTALEARYGKEKIESLFQHLTEETHIR